MKITRTAKELRSQSPAHHHQTWRTLRNAILCAELYEALRGGEKVVTVTESATKGETHDVYKVEITVEDEKWKTRYQQLAVHHNELCTCDDLYS